MVCQNITAEYRQHLFDYRFDIVIGRSIRDPALAEAGGGIGNGT